MNRPPKLEVHDFSTAAPMLSGVSANPGWPEVMSPSTEQKDRIDELGATAVAKGHESTSTTWSGTTVGGENTKSRPTTHGTMDAAEGGGTTRDSPVASSVSYAVAIYPYMAEQDDEFDVVV